MGRCRGFVFFCAFWVGWWGHVWGSGCDDGGEASGLLMILWRCVLIGFGLWEMGFWDNDIHTFMLLAGSGDFLLFQRM